MSCIDTALYEFRFYLKPVGPERLQCHDIVTVLVSLRRATVCIQRAPRYTHVQAALAGAAAAVLTCDREPFGTSTCTARSPAHAISIDSIDIKYD